MNFAIIDDEINFAENLQSKIATLCDKNGFDIKITCYDNAEHILDSNKYSEFDVIFLDIEMPEANGISIADKINRQKGDSPLPYIVFVTSKEHMVFEALKKLPYSFIRKNQLNDIEICIKQLCRKLTASPTYSIKDGRGVRTIEIKNITHIEKHRNYTVFYTTEGIFQERSNIDEKQTDLRMYNFLRPHIGSLINAIHIKEYQNDIITLSDKTEIHISRTYKKSFKEEFHNWLRR